MGIIEYLSKGRNPLTGLAGRKEVGALKQPNIQKHSLAKKKRPNTAGSAPLKQPKHGQIAGGMKGLPKRAVPKKSSSAQAGPKQGVVGHGSFLKNFWRRGMKIEFESQSGEKGIGRVRDWGKKGVQIVSEVGKVHHLFHHEIKGQYHPPESKGKK